MKPRIFIRSVISSLKLLFLSNDSLGKSAEPAPIDVIVSLTTIPSRLATLHLTIKSLLNQNISFDKIILWLNQDLADRIPLRLQELVSERFEICFCATTEPHRKLVKTLELYPDHYIVTCDDDMMYPRDWLSRLLESWQHTPNDVVAHMCRKIRIEEGQMLPYRTWGSEAIGGSSPLTLALGWGGVLFPPGVLDERILDRDLYMRLSPHADDLWFKAMAMLKGTAMRKSMNPDPEPVPILSTQAISLSNKNIDEDQNRVQLLALAEEFGLKFE